jgi:hypothetical protein
MKTRSTGIVLDEEQTVAFAPAEECISQDTSPLAIPDEICDPFDAVGRSSLTDQELAARIKQRIRMQTSGRIRALSVVVSDGQIEICGQCATFYTKQLAQHAAMGVLEDEVLTNRIDVKVGR